MPVPAFAFIPAGQGPVDPKKADKLKLRCQEKWPKGIHSFEAWCAATCYDPRLDDGGPLFQKMMFWVLTDSGSAGDAMLTPGDRKHSSTVTIDDETEFGLITKGGLTNSGRAGGKVGLQVGKANVPKKDGPPPFYQRVHNSTRIAGQPDIDYWVCPPHQVQAQMAYFPHSKATWCESAGLRIYTL